jgi:hypothetical protein
MSIMWNFWEWNGNQFIASLGYAWIGYGGGTLTTHDYDMKTQLVTLGTPFMTADTGGTICANATEAIHFANDASTQIEAMNWATKVLTQPASAGTGHGVSSMSIGNSVKCVIAEQHTGGGSLNQSFSMTYASNTVAARACYVLPRVSPLMGSDVPRPVSQAIPV